MNKNKRCPPIPPARISCIQTAQIGPVLGCRRSTLKEDCTSVFTSWHSRVRGQSGDFVRGMLYNHLAALTAYLLSFPDRSLRKVKLKTCTCSRGFFLAICMALYFPGMNSLCNTPVLSLLWPPKVLLGVWRVLFIGRNDAQKTYYLLQIWYVVVSKGR